MDIIKNQILNRMSAILKILMLVGIMSVFVGCKSTFDATETMKIPENREAVYEEIISNPGQLNEFIELAQQNETARKVLMHSHMQMMESGKMMEVMKNNPEIKEKMKTHMQKMMEENSEMKEKMQSMIIEKMLKSEEGRKMLMEKIHENPEIKKEMIEKMNENAAMMEEMLAKMMSNSKMKEKMMEKMMENPEFMEKMKSKMKEKKLN